ncbi:hypothetical protein MHYP_G00252090 [Metynnis hypsauchen]
MQLSAWVKCVENAYVSATDEELDIQLLETHQSSSQKASGDGPVLYEGSELSKEDEDGQQEAALNADALEFFLDNSMNREGQSAVHKTRKGPTNFKDVGHESEAEVESEASPVMGASRPSRRRAPPAYRSDYEIGYRASWEQLKRQSSTKSDQQ